MTENELNLQAISTMRADFQADHVGLLGQLTEKKEKAHPLHFLKFLCQPAFTHSVIDFNCVRESLRLFGTLAKPLKPTSNPSFAKEPNLPRATNNNYHFTSYYLRYNHNLDPNILTAMNRIKEVLANKAIKQTWLAEKLGKSYNLVNAYVQNRQQTRLEILIGIAAILDVDVKELIESTKKHDQR
jgi:putative transcriptional regulator